MMKIMAGHCLHKRLLLVISLWISIVKSSDNHHQQVSNAIQGDTSNTDDHNLTSMMLARLDALEHQTGTLSSRLQEAEQRNQEMQTMLTEAASALSAFAIRNEHQEEQLAQLETALMALIPEQQTQEDGGSARTRLDRNKVVGVSFHKETFQEYLGNRAAELVALMPDGGAKSNDVDGQVDLDVIGRAMIQLSDTNHILAKKVEHLEGLLQDSSLPPRQMGRGNLNVQLMDQLLKRISHIEDHTINSSTVDVGIKAESRKSAFSVAALRPQTGNSDGLTPLRLDYVFLNKGNDFNVTNSTFMCEVPGYYFFSYTMRTYYNHTLAVNLVKNDEYVVALYSDNSERNVMDSQSVMLELKPGDYVYLALGPSEKYAYYSDRNKLSTFSGFLLYKKS